MEDNRYYAFRCAKCGRLLGKIKSGAAEIKCPRCGAINYYDSKTGAVESTPKQSRR